MFSIIRSVWTLEKSDAEINADNALRISQFDNTPTFSLKDAGGTIICQLCGLLESIDLGASRFPLLSPTTRWEQYCSPPSSPPGRITKLFITCSGYIGLSPGNVSLATEYMFCMGVPCPSCCGRAKGMWVHMSSRVESLLRASWNANVCKQVLDNIMTNWLLFVK
jgi:hypothetical protein